jgi:hypothetical protein
MYFRHNSISHFSAGKQNGDLQSGLHTVVQVQKATSSFIIIKKTRDLRYSPCREAVASDQRPSYTTKPEASSSMNSKP